MRKATVKLLALLLALAMVAAACDSGDDTGDTDTTAPTGTTAPSDGDGGDGGDDTTTTAPPSSDVDNPGVFVHALDGEPTGGLDPAQTEEGGYGDRVIIQVYEFLLDLPPDSPEPIPMLATEVPSKENGLVSEDGLTITFPIRQGVKFHDGTDLTADDVKYSWDRVMTMDLPEGQSETLSSIVAETRVVDDYTFEVTLLEPAAWFLTSTVMSVPAAIVSQDYVEANGGVVAGEVNPVMQTSMSGTGPFKFVSWDRNIRLTFERNEDYWGEPAKLEGARFEVVPDNTAIVLGIRAGDYDLIEPTPQYIAELGGDPDVCVDFSGFLLEPLHLAFNLNIPEGALPDTDTIPTDFFWDKRVRQAFNHAFDYSAFIAAGLAGYGEPAKYLPPQMLGYSADAPSYEQNLAEAERLFRETGWWDEGFEVSVLVEAGNETFVPVGLVLKDSLERLNPEGFRVNVIQVAEAQFDEEHGKDPFEFAMWVKNGDPFNDPHRLMFTYFHPDGPWGQTLGFRNGYENADQLADVLDRAAVETDIQARAALYEEAQALIYEDPMWIWAADEQNIQIRRCWVEDFVYNPLWIMPRWTYYDKG
jgi:peptide/nickel transport system substrate-binding protein